MSSTGNTIYPLAPARPSAALAPGMWQPRVIDGRPGARIACPRCGATTDLNPRTHPINRYGQTPSWRCMGLHCHFASCLALHEFAALRPEDL